MGYQWQYAKPGIGRPIPNFAHGLWRQCLYASVVGSRRGHRVLAGPAYSGDFDDRFYPSGGGAAVAQGADAQIFTTGGFTPNGANWQSWNGGKGFDNGDGATSNNTEGWTDSLGPTIPGVGTGNRYDVPQTSPQIGMTWAIAIRPDVQSSDINLPFFKRRAQPFGAAQAGWHWSGDTGNTWRIEISDGVTEFHRTSTTVQDPLGRRTDLLVCRYNAVPGSATNSRMELWVNGIAEAGVAGSPSFATVVVGNPAGEFLKLLGYDSLNNTFAGEIPFAAFWTRPLANGELNQLYTDWAIMWRWLNQSQAIFAPPTVPQLSAIRGAVAATNLAAISLFSPASNPALAAQRGAPPPVVANNILTAPPIVPAAGPVVGVSMGACCCCIAAATLMF